MKTLIVAEKPDMGRNIAAAIEPKAQNKRSYLEGETYIVTWAIGHLIGLAEPDRYDERYKKWNFTDLPIIPQTFKLIPNDRTKDQLKVIAELAKRCDRLINACDAGREGQLIFSYIQQHLKLRQPVRRLWISDLTPETIRRGFAELKDGAEYENLTKAARSRSEADWLIGMNGSRAFTTRHRALLSVGRVQTPVLALIYDRQLEIEAFQSAKFFEIEAMFRQESCEYKGRWQGGRLTDPEEAERLAAKVDGKQGRIAGYEVKETKEYPFKLYDLTLLQREANARYGFSAKKTLDLAQALYEKHKLISYPRTNSNYVNEQNIAPMHKTLASLKGTSYEPLVSGANPRLVGVHNKLVCNPAKVEDHHAILPTGKRPGTLSADESKVYDLVVRRFLSHFYPAAEYKVHTVQTEVEGEAFRTTIKQLQAIGWKAVYADLEAGSGKRAKGAKGSAGQAGDADGEQAQEAGADRGSKQGEGLEQTIDGEFALDAAAAVLCASAQAVEKKTQPPKPYTEGTLLKAMESAGKQIEDEEVREAMKDAGLGTPATRASVIERLKQVGYTVMAGKQIRITPKGRAAVELIRGAGIELLTSPEMTGRWERRLNEIAKGKASDAPFMESVKKFAQLIVEKVATQSPAARQAFGEADGAEPARRAGKRGRSGSASRGGVREGAVGAGSASRGASGAEAAASAGAGAAVQSTASRAAGLPPGSREGTPALHTTAKIADCPREGCGGYIFMGRKGYGCSNYRSGCRFVIWKQSLGKTLSGPMIRSLIEKGRTSKLKLTVEAGQSGTGRIILLDASTGKLGLEWAD